MDASEGASGYRRVRDLMATASGDEKHDGSASSTLDVLWVLYDRVLRYDPRRPHAPERDRFLLSKGHGPLALYAVLSVKGFFPPDELSTFMTARGRLGGHPDRNLVPGIEASTGSLGHGIAMAVGVALALAAAASDRRVFVLVGDGEANEGSVWEAALLAGTVGLPNLTAIVVDNHSSTRPMGDIAAKFAAFGWAATTVHGHDHDKIRQALVTRDGTRPTLVVADVPA